MTVGDLKKPLKAEGPLGDLYELDPNAKYILFVDPRCVDVLALADTETSVDMEIIPVLQPLGGTIHDVISLYRKDG